MGFWKDLFSRAKNKIASPEEETELEAQYLVGAEDVNLADEYERSRYIESLLQQVSDASRQVDEASSEYKTVNSYLRDIEELEFIRGEDRKQLVEHAKSIVHLSLDKERYQERKNRMSDDDFERMQRLEDDTDEGALRLKEAEEYQQLVRADLKRLEGEKQACLFRRQEAETHMNNLRGMTQIALIAIAACVLILLAMQFGFEMNAQIGFMLTAGAGAIVLTALYMSYLDASKEKVRASRSLNKVILLQNRVKIRYVNNTNLLEYLYMKFGISSAAELERLREKYGEEKEEREKIRENMHQLTFSQEEMVSILRKYKLFDPLIWLHQARAIYDPKEMVEVRHALILRRQKIRQQLDFNSQNASAAQEQIRSIVAEYPQYAKEILQMVSDFEVGRDHGA